MSLTNLKLIAYEKVARKEVPFEDLEDMLKIWWSNKYNLPKNHPLLLDSTLEELLIDYFVDVFSKDKKEIENFEVEMRKLHPDAIPDIESKGLSDEEWFKKVMGDEYTEQEAHSLAYGSDLKKLENQENSSKSEGKKEDTFEDVFTSLGG